MKKGSGKGQGAKVNATERGDDDEAAEGGEQQCTNITMQSIGHHCTRDQAIDLECSRDDGPIVLSTPYRRISGRPAGSSHLRKKKKQECEVRQSCETMHDARWDSGNTSRVECSKRTQHSQKTMKNSSAVSAAYAERNYKKISQMQQQLRPAQSTREETRKTKDPELADGLKIPNFVMNCPRRAMVIVEQNMTRYDYRKMVYVDEGRTDEPRSLPHFSSL